MAEGDVATEKRPQVDVADILAQPGVVGLGDVTARVEDASVAEKDSKTQLGDAIRAKFEEYRGNSKLKEQVRTEEGDSNLERIDLPAVVAASYRDGDKTISSATEEVIAQSKPEVGSGEWHFNRTQHTNFYRDRLGIRHEGERTDEHLQMIDGKLTYISATSNEGVPGDSEIIPHEEDTPQEAKDRIDEFLKEALTSLQKQ